jgi:hypothetical protein
MDWDLLSSYAGLLSLATVSVYVGSCGALPVSDQCSAVTPTNVRVHHRNPYGSRRTRLGPLC